MFLLVGLGNPGSEYAFTRHNMGFWAVDEIVRRFSFNDWKKSGKGLIAVGEIDGQKVIALKPQTYMNLSGEAVLAALSFYKLKPENVIVFHDELALPVGKVKVKVGGGAAGHNGLKNIDAHIGPNYMRVRIGVDQDKSIDAADYVLARPSKEEQDHLALVVDKIAQNVALLLNGKEQNFMNLLVEEK